MTTHAMNQAAEPKAQDAKPSRGAMAMCPMATMCMGMTEKRFSGFMLMLPGILLILVGVLIVIEPKILVWLVAAAAVLLGIMMLMMAAFIRRLGARLRA